MIRKYPSLKSELSETSSYISEWMNSSRGIPLTQYVTGRGISRAMTSSSIRFTYYPDFVSEIEKSKNIFQDLSKYTQFGVWINIAKTDPTLMECFFVFIVWARHFTLIL